MSRSKLRFREALGLLEPKARMKEAWIALAGAEDVPASQFGLSSLRQIRPKIGFPLWMGREVVPRRAIMTNLFNHQQTPIEDGWSVKVTQVEDFRGRNLTYDSHNGTDFAIPIGSDVCATAPGEVVRSYTEYNRGGHKLVIDHGDGFFTCYAHLTRATVSVGERVARGQKVAISGYSGLDALTTFPLGTPHIHFNTWLNGEAVDPFARSGEESLWIDGNDPKPARSSDADFQRTNFDDVAVSEAIAGCRTPSTREMLESIADPYLRAATLVSEWNYYPTRFSVWPEIIRDEAKRSPRMTLPLSAEDFDGIVFFDDL